MVKPSVVQKHVEDRDATAVAEAVRGLYHCWICHKHSGVAVWLADSVSTSWGGGGATDYIWPCGGYKGESSTGMLHRTHKRLKYGMIDGLESDHKRLEALHLFFSQVLATNGTAYGSTKTPHWIRTLGNQLATHAKLRMVLSSTGTEMSENEKDLLETDIQPLTLDLNARLAAMFPGAPFALLDALGNVSPSLFISADKKVLRQLGKPADRDAEAAWVRYNRKIAKITFQQVVNIFDVCLAVAEQPTKKRLELYRHICGSSSGSVLKALKENFDKESNSQRRYHKHVVSQQSRQLLLAPG